MAPSSITVGRDRATLRALSTACVMTTCDKRHPAHKAYRVVRGVAQRHVARFPAAVRDYITLVATGRRDCCGPICRPDAQFHPLANIIDVEHAPPVDVGRQPATCGGRAAGRGEGCCACRRGCRAHAGCRSCSSATDRCGRKSRRPAHAVTGWLSGRRCVASSQHARCLVFPSLWYETFGLVVAEAAARGVPAIVSDVSAPPSGWSTARPDGSSRVVI